MIIAQYPKIRCPDCNEALRVTNISGNLFCKQCYEEKEAQTEYMNQPSKHFLTIQAHWKKEEERLLRNPTKKQQEKENIRRWQERAIRRAKENPPNR